MQKLINVDCACTNRWWSLLTQQCWLFRCIIGRCDMLQVYVGLIFEACQKSSNCCQWIFCVISDDYRVTNLSQHWCEFTRDDVRGLEFGLAIVQPFQVNNITFTSRIYFSKLCPALFAQMLHSISQKIDGKNIRFSNLSTAVASFRPFDPNIGNLSFKKWMVWK